MKELIKALQTQLEKNSDDISEQQKAIKIAEKKLEELKVRRRNYLQTLISELKARNLYSDAKYIEKKEKDILSLHKSMKLKNSEFLVEFVKSNEQGVLPADIIQSFSSSERSMKKNSIYALIMRMKREGRINERNGRYY